MESNSPGQNSTWGSSDVSRAPRVIFLVAFMMASSVGSLFIITVLVQNVKLRSVQNLLIANVCVVCIMDCIFNMTLVMGSLIANEWVYGAFMCKVNTFFMNLVAIKTMLMLTALSIDHYFSFRFAYKYETWLSSYRIRPIIAYFWLHSLAFSIPFLTNGANSIFRPQLNLCTVTGEASLAFIFITLLVCFLGPLTIIVVIHIFNCRQTCRLRYIKRTDVAEKSYTQMRNETPHTTHQSHSYMYIVILFLLWLVLEIPFIVTSYIEQYEYSQQLMLGTVIDYSWEVSATFVWMRFFFSAVFPFVTFFFKKEIWQSAKECVLCRRHNSIVDIDVVNAASDLAGRKEVAKKVEKDVSSKAKDRDKENSETHNSLAFNVPVLFATSTGICIEDSTTGYSFGESDHTTSTTDTLQLKGKTLDISYPKCEYKDDLLDDTSDYDSSCDIDQFSSSQPVSSRNVLRAVRRTRSMSDPEISCHHGKIKVKDNNKDFCVTFIADSGLDLSGTGGSSLEGTINSKSRVTRVTGLVSGNSQLTETAADTHTRDNVNHCAEPSSENLRLQRETESTEFFESNDASSSHLSVHLTPLEIDNASSFDARITRERHKTEKCKGSLSSESSPQKKQSNVAEEKKRAEPSTTQGKSNEADSSRINIEGKGDRQTKADMDVSVNKLLK